MISPAVNRECVHTRNINLNGYRRQDGLIDIEGEMTDSKTYDFSNRDRGTIHAGEYLHHMRVRITINDAMEIVAAEAETLAGPFAICPKATAIFDRLVGITIGVGWRKNVRNAIGNVEGCTHITELMGPVATVAFQTVFGEKSRNRDAKEGNTENISINLVDSCIGYAR